MVGDAGKNFSKLQPRARLQLDLTSRHPENLRLGNYVMDCVAMLGIQYSRYSDRPPRKRHPHAEHRWQTYESEVIAWLFTACLGLEPNELTSYDSIRMDWLLTASREARIWFLRGIADSDATVNLRNKTVDIITGPNSAIIIALLDSLEVQTQTWISKGASIVSIPAKEAMELWIFNPEIETHRGRLLRKLADAQVYPRRWPPWLYKKVDKLLAEGVTPGRIRDKLLWEDNTYVKLKSIWSRVKVDKPAPRFGRGTPCLRGN